MCKHTPVAAEQTSACAQTTDITAPHSDGSRRWRLWELPAPAHCPVIGICIPTNVLRKHLKKIVDADLSISDYDFHVGAVGHARTRNPISSTLHKLLDGRFAADIRAFQSAKSKAALVALWVEAIDDGDVAGAFWASLTHPLCSVKMQEALVHDMHLLQHQACAMFRASSKDSDAQAKRNAELIAALRHAQDRHSRQGAEKNERIISLQRELSQAHGEIQSRDQKIVALASRLTSALVPSPDMQSAARQRQTIGALQQQQQTLEKRIRELERRLQRKTVQISAERCDAPKRQHTSEAPADSPPGKLDALQLSARNVLCVGGRAGNVPDYRDIVEQAGARFAYHDGGIEHHQGLLESGLAAADMVICQTGCISHSAYWRVKEFCKRTGKRCVYVDNPSTSSLIQSLKSFAGAAPDLKIQLRG